ncbi:Bug family tripartite tricarboxylate transporter substrate binding protein [Piscinibacter sp.]|uniref:Bug family tripartite tricarboxylate transporter substrate binding protein n=1 Tax=Piscinibacter sp. TaxID=1903157 RepID=UPI0039E53925
MTFVRSIVTGVLLSLCSALACAQKFPAGPVTIVVPFPAGGGVDNLARQLAKKLAERWGQQVLIDNKAGASGFIAAQHVARAAPDGQTLLFTAEPIVSINPLVFKKLPYSVDDFAPISALVSLPQALFVSSSNANIQTVPDLLAYARKNPGRLNYGSFGPASSPQLAMELFKSLAKVDIQHVPYKGGSPAMVDLGAGTIDMVITGAATAKPMLDAGKVRMIAISGKSRSPNHPNVPTFAEVGLPDMEATAYLGILAPVKTPQPVMQELTQSVRAVMADRSFVETHVIPQNQVPLNSTGEEYARLIKSVSDLWAPVVKQAGITAD